MKFKFTLDPVLKVRKHQEKVQKQKLAEELIKKNEINELRAEVQNKLENYLQNAQTRNIENIHGIKRHTKHMEQVHSLIKKLSTDLNKAEKAVSEERGKLAQAYKNRHILDKVKEFEQNIFAQKLQRNEQKNMDEIATQIYSR